MFVSISNPSNFSAELSPEKISKKWLWLTLGLIGVAAVSASAGALLAVSISSTPLMQSRLSREEARAFNPDQAVASGKNLQLPTLTRPVNIMVLGVKVLTTDLENPPANAENLGYQALVNSLDGLSDTMLMVRFDPAQRKLVVLSIPRDTRTWVQGIGLTKLNAANSDGGPALAAKATSELLGDITIDRYIRINVQGVEKLLDALGGVKLYVPQDMRYQDDSQHLYINLKQGEQHLNGAQALQFLRFRYDNLGDIGRVQRQQMFMRALMEQALNPATLARLPQILSVIQANIDTNLSVEELVALVGFAGQSDRPKAQMLMVPGEFSTADQFEASYWLPNQVKLDALVAQYFGTQPPAASEGAMRSERLEPEVESFAPIQVAIQDSTGKLDTAKLLKTLSAAGYGGGFVDHPWSQRLEQTQIIAQQGDGEAAEAIRQTLGFGEVQIESTGNLESNITIRMGQDALGSRAIAPLRSNPSPTSTPSPSPAALADPKS
ncbi:MAG: LCP family protein [Leptolyngbyaceae cyanobacterium CSU_1_4]|nr:LCP family protein [Leptolyngbyaceae cyanobacterium CSU_1_4]